MSRRRPPACCRQPPPRPAAGGALAYARAHPVVAFGTLAGVLAAGFGVYVYLQMFHPALFVAQPPLASTAAGSRRGAGAAGRGRPQRSPLPVEALAFRAAAEGVCRRGVAPPARVRDQKPAAAAAAQRRGNAIVVSRGNAEPVMNPLLPQAYAALQAGQLDDAQRALQPARRRRADQHRCAARPRRRCRPARQQRRGDPALPADTGTRPAERAGAKRADRAARARRSAGGGIEAEAADRARAVGLSSTSRWATCTPTSRSGRPRSSPTSRPIISTRPTPTTPTTSRSASSTSASPSWRSVSTGAPWNWQPPGAAPTSISPQAQERIGKLAAQAE